MENKFTNEFFIEPYLKEMEKLSPGSFSNNKHSIKALVKDLPKPLMEIKMRDMQNYFINHIDSQEIKKTTKNTKRYILMSFFNYIQRTLLSYDVEYSNPVPSKKIYKFSTNTDDITRISDEELKVLTLVQIKKILAYTFHDLGLRNFILVGLIIATGARISEIRTLMVKDLNLENNSFQTGFIPGARKTSLSTKKGLLFFFPSGFAKYIQEYLDNCKKCETWLFSGYFGSCLSRSGVQEILIKIRKSVNFYFSWHYFRKTIITERTKLGCEKWLSEGLANHAPSDVQAKSYVKLKFKEKQSFFNKYFPYTSITYFK